MHRFQFERKKNVQPTQYVCIHLKQNSVTRGMKCIFHLAALFQWGQSWWLHLLFPLSLFASYLTTTHTSVAVSVIWRASHMKKILLFLRERTFSHLLECCLNELLHLFNHVEINYRRLSSLPKSNAHSIYKKELHYYLFYFPILKDYMENSALNKMLAVVCRVHYQSNERKPRIYKVAQTKKKPQT